MTATSYALWLRPDAASAATFAQLIEALSHRLGTPRFQPHMTLSGVASTTEADAIARSKRLAAALAPVPIHLIGAGHTDAYFRCLFLRAEKTPPLLAAHRLASAEMQQPTDADFMPHLSLVYGALATPVKEKIIEELDSRFPRNFLADSISLCAIAGAPDEWRPIGPFFLTGE